MVSGSEFFDDDEMFKKYWQNRQRSDNPNDAIEKPIILDLIGNVKYADVLDLGCGAGEFGNLLLDLGCQSYTGIEGSAKMVKQAQKSLDTNQATVIHGNIENYSYPINKYHLIVSRLTLHYIDNLQSLFTKLLPALKQGGRFVFSVEHPVMTSHNESLEKSGKRSNWIVDNYFKTGQRQATWMGKDVIKYHRTVEDFFQMLQNTGFTILSLRESKPKLENFHDPLEYERRQRIPMFLFFSAQVLQS
jgi:SAM-dependent methyltransferase